MKTVRVGQVFIDLMGWDIGIVTKVETDHFVGHFSYAEHEGAPHNYHFKHDMREVMNITAQLSRQDEIERIMVVLKDTFPPKRYKTLAEAVEREAKKAQDER